MCSNPLEIEVSDFSGVRNGSIWAYKGPQNLLDSVAVSVSTGYLSVLQRERGSSLHASYFTPCLLGAPFWGTLSFSSCSRWLVGMVWIPQPKIPGCGREGKHKWCWWDLTSYVCIEGKCETVTFDARWNFTVVGNTHFQILQITYVVSKDQNTQ